eukprot:5256797-Pyramimonas_sp.AAC.1
MHACVRGATFYVAQFIVPTPLLAQSSHPPTCDFVCTTHAAAIVMTAWRRLAHRNGRASARRLAREAAG